MKHGFIIPVYRHSDTVKEVVKKLSAYNLPIILIDDGNEKKAKDRIAEIAANTPLCIPVVLNKNTGKGGAFAKGLEKAAEIGLTHVFQIDADGQHDTDKIPFFLEESQKNPYKLICGYPVFDANAPKSRVKGRKISNFWGVIVSLSFDLKDMLCGYRIYPVQESLKVTKHPLFNRRMGFDAEILVRLYWKKIYPVFYPVKINYPEGGVSNFRMIRDNLNISATFCRLCIGMIIRLPLLIIHKITRKNYDK